MVVLALLGGATGLSLSAKAAPMTVPITAAQNDAAPLVQNARWHGRRHWHRHHRWHGHHRWHRHHHWRRHHHHHHHGHHRRLRFY
jgi:hypothetical protein